MAISTKGKRKIIVNDRLYVWYVKTDEYTAISVKSIHWGDTVYIISDDHRFSIHYLIGSDFITVVGKEFNGDSQYEYNGCGQRVRYPLWSTGLVTSKTVQEMILWCKADKKSLVHVDYCGRPLS